MPNLTEQYEKELAHHTGVNHVIAFGFARHALVASLSSAGLATDDEVILSPLTCKVVPLALQSIGLNPVYADISGTTLNLDSRNIKSCISTKTRAILFQHTYGYSGGVQAVSDLANQHGLFMLEDCAQCLPVFHERYSPGHHGGGAIFSNNPGKPLPIGSGGIAITNDRQLAGKIRLSRDKLPLRPLSGELRLYIEELLHHYILRPSLYWFLFNLNKHSDPNYTVRNLADEISSEVDGEAYRPSDRQMRLGSRHMNTLPEIKHHRTECCDLYTRSLEQVTGIETPYCSYGIPLYYYPVLVNNKAELLQKASRERVEIIPWPVKTPIYPVEDFSVLKNYGYRQGCCPLAESIAERLVGLPTHKKVTSAVLSKITEFLKRNVQT